MGLPFHRRFAVRNPIPRRQHRQFLFRRAPFANPRYAGQVLPANHPAGRWRAENHDRHPERTRLQQWAYPALQQPCPQKQWLPHREWGKHHAISQSGEWIVSSCKFAGKVVSCSTQHRRATALFAARTGKNLQAG